MTIRITWARLVLALLAVVLAGLAFAWTGLFNVGASTGHWKVTEWFLHWTMRNSVKTHSYWGTPEAVTTDQSLVSAAGHFAQSCVVCHGAPGVRPSPVMQAAMPPAPDLAINARDWSDRHLFWILEHGVKFSGMPAWAAKDRPDEIARMVAFVRRIPTMTPARYRALTEVPGGDQRLPGVRPGVLARCVACHGADGRGRGQPDVPVLGGQKAAYLADSLAAYATGARASAVMSTAAAQLTATERVVLARHFAVMPGIGTATGRRDPAARRVITQGLPTNQLPACASCHAAGKRYPVIAGQRATYLAQRLRQWHGDETIVDARQSQATMPVIGRRIPENLIDPLATTLSGE